MHNFFILPVSSFPDDASMDTQTEVLMFTGCPREVYQKEFRLWERKWIHILPLLKNNSNHALHLLTMFYVPSNV